MMEFISKLAPSPKTGLTIGYLEDNLYDDFHNQLMMGIWKAAKEYNVNIVRFGCFSPFITYEIAQQVDRTLDHVQQYNLDGLMFLGWTKTGPRHHYENFTSRFSSIPILSLGAGFNNIPYLYFPGNTYVRDLLLHLIHHHQRRRIVYICPMVADNRQDAYLETMKAHGLYDPQLVIQQEDVEGLPVRERARRVLSILLDERKIRFDAIVSLYIIETEIIMEGLRERRLKVPRDVAVASYEAGDFGKFHSPSITTIEFPWMELGYQGCKRMVQLIRDGRIPAATAVEGKIIYRDSCGCLSNAIKIVEDQPRIIKGKTLKQLADHEKQALIRQMEEAFPHTNVQFRRLLDAFLIEYERRAGNVFIQEIIDQLRSFSYQMDYSNTENIISVFRKLLMPYIASEEETLLWAGDLFQQCQVLVREKIASVNIYEKANEKIEYQNLQEISRKLIVNFNRNNLFESLEQNLPWLKIKSCYIFLFQGSGEGSRIFDTCTLAFEFDRNQAVVPTGNQTATAKEHLERILSGRQAPCTLFSHILHVEHEFLGFILFEPGPMGERAYQFLSACISTALNGAGLLDKLDSAYKKLVDQAQREGMAEIATGIMHNIGNILNSVNASVSMMEEMAGSAAFDDFFHANQLLEKHMDHLDEFITQDAKAKKLMKFYLKLGTPFSEIQQKSLYHMERLTEKVNSINEIIISQQNYAGVNTVLEELDISTVLEDVIRLHAASIEKFNIDVIKDFQVQAKVLFQRIKMFHILVNLMNNAIEAMAETPVNERFLKFTVTADQTGKYIHIADNGCGIAESYLEKIFNEGYTTKKSRQGIGLNSCSRYMADMGGEIYARSEGQGKGATFTLKFR